MICWTDEIATFTTKVCEPKKPIMILCGILLGGADTLGDKSVLRQKLNGTLRFCVHF
jgi:hypothetical protein